jgi:F-type H+-transporting ATPase subunit delta
MVLGEMLEVLRLRIDEHNGLKPAVVSTAVELDDDQKARLLARMQEVTGRTYSMEYRVQPGLMGGVVFQAGDMLIDWSVKHRLADLRDRLLHVKLPSAG